VTSERIQRQIDRLLDAADQAFTARDWAALRDASSDVLSLDSENAEAKAFMAAAERNLSEGLQAPAASPHGTLVSPSAPQPTSFANGRYEVRRFLGEGGKKRVYLAHDTQLDRDVAFALIKTEGLDEAARVRVTREAQAMGRLGSHPHIVTVYDIGEEDSHPYLVLPVLPGGDVEGVIEKAEGHKLPVEQAVKIAAEVCLGLEFSHSKGIIHRDLKPGNVWVAEDGRAMIGDFGLAVAVDRSRLTQAGMMVGTVSYMPPEQAMGGEVTPQSDLYSLGAMLYEMVCGRPPFIGDESVAIIGQHLNTPPVAPSWHRPDCPPGLEALILRLLEKDPSRRPASAAEVREALQAVGSARPEALEGRAGAPSSTEVPSAPDPLYRRTFVGRENETRQLQRAYDAAVSGQGGLVMVVGEPGIGKTALCEQLATYVQLRGGKTLVGHCYEEGSLSLPYLAFVEAMRSYVLARDPDALRSELGTGAAEVARIVSEVRDRVHLPVRPEALEGRDAGDPEDDRWRLLNAVSTFLRNAATVQPLVIVLEDLHWADRGTLDLLLHVARNLEGARLLIVGTYRDVEVDRQHPLSSALADIRRIGNFLRVPLRGLTVDEVHRMYEAIRGNAVPWGQAEAVHRATEGNPLFVQEVLRYLVEEGFVVREDGQYVARAPGEGLPDGLRDVVGRRLSHLSEKANQVLSVASVIGRDFRLDVLQKVVGLNEDEVLEALEEATERSIIEQRPAAGSVGFRFTHAFFRQVLYEEIFAPRRIRWHQEVGRATEDTYARRLEDHAAELAEHFAQSTETSDLEKAVRYGELAAQRAMALFAYGEAVRHFEQALRAQDVLAPDDGLKRCDLLLSLGEALVLSGDPLRAAGPIAEEAYTIADSLHDNRRGYDACRLALGGLGTYGAVSITTSPAYNEWLDRYEGFIPPDPIEHIVADARRAGRLFSARRLRDGLNALGPVIDSALEYGGNAIVDALWTYLTLPVPPDEMPRKLRVAREFIKAYMSPRPASTRLRINATGVSLVYAALTILDWGDREETERMWSVVEEMAERRPEPSLLVHKEMIESLRACLDGRLEEALAATERAAERGSELGAALQGAQMSVGMVRRPAVYLGRLDVFRRAAQRYAALVGSSGSSQPGGPLANTAPGSPDALATVRQLLANVPGEDVPVLFLCNAMETACEANERELVERLLPLLDAASDLATGQYSLACPARLLGDGARLTGKSQQAMDYYVKAIAICQKVRFRPELALSRLGLAEVLLDHYPEEHDAALEHLDFAIAEFREMKMQPALERALGRRGLLKA
jgi:tetratricopeptide (TPR) repeat protein